MTDPLIANTYLNRYWNLSQTGITDFSCDAVFQYQPGDVVGTESNLTTIRITPVPATMLGAVNAGLHQLNATGIDMFGTFTGAPEITLSVFNVTGSGTYCAGDAGLEVGLDGSESGITYTLYKNSVAQIPVVIGTGSPISFGMQMAGDYTVKAENGTSNADMTGMAQVIEVQLPDAPLLSVVQPDCNVSTGTITVNSPMETGMTYSIDGVNYGNSDGIFSLLTPGDYVVTAMNSAGCISNGVNATIVTVCSNCVKY